MKNSKNTLEYSEKYSGKLGKILPKIRIPDAKSLFDYGKLLPWLETYSCQPVLDGKDGEQLQMLGLYFEKGKLWQFAGMGEVLLDGHQ